MNQYYDAIVNENKLLTNQTTTDFLNEKTDNQDVEDQRSSYLNLSNLNLRYINNVLFGIYLLLFIVLAYLIYSKNMPWKGKLAILLLLLLYPFFISSLQDNLRFLYNFLFSDTTNINTSEVENNDSKLKNNYTPSSDLNSKQYDSIRKENSILDTANTNTIQDSETNDRHSILISTETENHKYWNIFLLVSYYLCFAGFLYVLFTNPVFTFSIYLKVVLVLLLAAYPFYINKVVNFLMYLLTMLYSLIMTQTYKDPNAKYDTIIPNY